ncbi:MAG: hypothetical protein DCO97_11985 [Marivita sp. XM-24bin2]|nr:MAG: hypothetical protein DCO97_11985 [Marivita sp. XM-24bin2]
MGRGSLGRWVFTCRRAALQLVAFLSVKLGDFPAGSNPPDLRRAISNLGNACHEEEPPQACVKRGFVIYLFDFDLLIFSEASAKHI